MSDNPFSLPPVPLMTPERARDVARGYEALAEHFAEIRVPSESTRAERQSQWWLAYSISLATTRSKPDEGIDA